MLALHCELMYFKQTKVKRESQRRCEWFRAALCVHVGVCQARDWLSGLAGCG